jgi:hypothetical protein
VETTNGEPEAQMSDFTGEKPCFDVRAHPDNRVRLNPEAAASSNPAGRGISHLAPATFLAKNASPRVALCQQLTHVR